MSDFRKQSRNDFKFEIALGNVFIWHKVERATKLSVCLAELLAPTPKECTGRGWFVYPVQSRQCYLRFPWTKWWEKSQDLLWGLEKSSSRHCPREKRLHCERDEFLHHQLYLFLVSHTHKEALLHWVLIFGSWLVLKLQAGFWIPVFCLLLFFFCFCFSYFFVK